MAQQTIIENNFDEYYEPEGVLSEEMYLKNSYPKSYNSVTELESDGFIRLKTKVYERTYSGIRHRENSIIFSKDNIRYILIICCQDNKTDYCLREAVF